MRIVGFGDSFIMKSNSPHDDELRKLYLNIVGEKLNADIVEWHGVAGTGPWDAFFNFLDYPNKDKVDIVVFAWSEASRIYHPTVKPLNFASVMNSLENPGVSKRKTWVAAQQYYEYLHDDRKADYEVTALYHMVDEMTKQYPNIRFIHMWAYPVPDHNAPDQIKRYKNTPPEKFEYYYTWKNGAEIRPALIYQSVHDEWPNDIANERRTNHLTFRMHKAVAEAIIDAATKFELGKIFNIVQPTDEEELIEEPVEIIDVLEIEDVVEIKTEPKKSKKTKKSKPTVVEKPIETKIEEPVDPPKTRSLLSILNRRP